MLPILRALVDGQSRHWRDQRDVCVRELDITDDDLAETIPSGKSRFDNRVQWAHSHLFQAGLIDRPARGHVQITERGQASLAEQPDRLDVSYLCQFEEYQDFRSRTRPSGSERDVAVASTTPWETIDSAVRESDQALSAELLSRIVAREPDFLEKLVLELLTAMGYGGRAGATEHWGRSGDGGIDGTIRQDELGLDRIFVQAKRYNTQRAVGRPDIQAFVGALHGVQADRGVFITTSRFSQEARDYVERIPNRLILIDGPRLVELMLLYNVGVQHERTFVLKRIDEDFFE